MPYIITTVTPSGWRSPDVFDGVTRTSRTAVATLEEARENTREIIYSHKLSGRANDPMFRNIAQEWHAIGESGGTVGPLPDGTIIEVRRVDNFALGVEAGLLPVDHPSMWPVADLVSRFNAS